MERNGRWLARRKRSCQVAGLPDSHHTITSKFRCRQELVISDPIKIDISENSQGSVGKSNSGLTVDLVTQDTASSIIPTTCPADIFKHQPKEGLSSASKFQGIAFPPLHLQGSSGRQACCTQQPAQALGTRTPSGDPTTAEQVVSQVASAAGTAQGIATPYLQQQRSSGRPAQQPAEVPGTTVLLSEPTTGEHNVSQQADHTWACTGVGSIFCASTASASPSSSSKKVQSSPPRAPICQAEAGLQADQDLVSSAVLTPQQLELKSQIHTQLLAFIEKQGWSVTQVPKQTEIEASNYCVASGQSLHRACKTLAAVLQKAVQLVQCDRRPLSRPYTAWQLLALRLGMQAPPSRGGGPARRVIPYGDDAPRAAQAAAEQALAPWDPPNVPVLASDAQQRRIRSSILKVMEQGNLSSFPTEGLLRSQYKALDTEIGKLGRGLIKAVAVNSLLSSEHSQKSIFDAVSNHFGIRRTRTANHDQRLETIRDWAVDLNRYVRDSKGLQVSDEDCHDLCLFTVPEARTWSAQQKCGLADAIKRRGGLKELIQCLQLTSVNPTSPGARPTKRLIQPRLKETTEVQQLADLMTQITLEQQDVLGTCEHPDWQLWHIPRTYALTKLGDKGSQLANKIKAYGRSQLALDLNWGLADSVQAPKGYFSNPATGYEHCLEEALRLLREVWGRETTPPRSFFGSIAQIVPKVHKKSWQEFIKELELCPLRHARDYWTRERVCQNTLEYARLSGAPSLFPTQDELNEVSIDQGHPLQFLAKGLAIKISRIGGGQRKVMEDTGLKQQAGAQITEEDDKLLATMLEQNPKAGWTQLAACFNAHALRRKWPERSAVALVHRLARTSVKALLVAAAARQLSTDAACVTSELLLPFLDSQGSADLARLRVFVSSCSMLMRDCSRKCVPAMQLLESLCSQSNAAAGSEAWLSLLRQQEEVAVLLREPLLLAQMHNSGRKVTMQQVWDSTPQLSPWKLKWLALPLDDQQLMEALRAVAKAAAEQIDKHVQQGDDICKELRPVHIDHAMAHVLMKLLPVGSVGMHIHSIQEQPLVDQGSWRKTVGHFVYANVPLLPNCAEQWYREHDVQLPTSWGSIRKLDWASKRSLMDEAADGPGVYQIFLDRYEMINGKRTLVLRTEWYIGEGAVLCIRLKCYCGSEQCQHPGPWGEWTKANLYLAACECGFEFSIRLLKLPKSMPQSIVFDVEGHWLRAGKNPMNKMLSGNFRCQPVLNAAGRCNPDACSPKARIDDYTRTSSMSRATSVLGFSAEQAMC